MRLDDLYLVDVVEAGRRVARMVAGSSSDQFRHDETLASAVQFQLIVVGEACGKMGAETLALMSETPAHAVRGLRNRLVHGYFSVDLEIVWEVATVHLPIFAVEAEVALKSLFPETFSKMRKRREEDVH